MKGMEGPLPRMKRAAIGVFFCLLSPSQSRAQVV